MSDTGGNNVNIRVVALAHATNRNEDVCLVADIDTTIHQLKQRLQEKLHHAPRPESQRLIYQGRPLMDSNATLRQILRIDSTSTGNPPAHVLHLVIRDNQMTSSTSTNGLPAMSAYNPEFNAVHDHMRRTVDPEQLARANLLRPADLNNYHHQNLHMPQASYTPASSTIPQFSYRQHVQAHQSQTSADMPDISSQTQTFGAGRNNLSQANPFFHTPSNAVQNGTTIRVHEMIGPNGERVRRVEQNAPILPGHMLPVERSASAPGSAVHLPGTDTPGGHNAMPSSNPSVSMRTPFRQLTHPQQLFGGMPAPPVNQVNLNAAPHTNPAGNTAVYVLLSSAGPQAVLFAPNHGLFSSEAAPSTGRVASRVQSRNTETDIQPQHSSTSPTQPTRAPPQQGQPDQVAQQPQVAAPVQAHPQPGRREGEDIVALVLQRGWLFLRLYMFIFVLSEPGTWRRYILLSIASLMCLLPRHNPLTDLFQAARRHFDNLIGPAQPPHRLQRTQEPGQQEPGNDAGTGSETNTTTTTQHLTQPGNQAFRTPTPAEHARRLLRDHAERNPSAIRDTIYRVEHALALFLASLIPGVGERHVRAREEARRIANEEAERHRREREERLEPQNEIDIDKAGTHPSQSVHASSSHGDDPIATASGADTALTDTASEPPSEDALRMRSGGHVPHGSHESSAT